MVDAYSPLHHSFVVGFFLDEPQEHYTNVLA